MKAILNSVQNHSDDEDSESEASSCTKIIIKIAEGKNFPVMDALVKSSDPYCVVRVDGQNVVRTMTVYRCLGPRSLSPFWNEEYTLQVIRNFYALYFYVYDEDLRFDDPIGKVMITRNELIKDYKQGFEGWFPLKKITKDSEVQGEVRLEFKLSETKLEVKIAEARDLAAKDNTGSSDPYGILTLGSHSFQTEVRKQTRFPKWNAMTVLAVPASADDDAVVYLTLWDKDIVGKDEFMGEVSFPLRNLEKGVQYNEWFWLKPRDVIGHQAAGSIRLHIRYFTTSILPSRVYKPLVEFFIEDVENYLKTADVADSPGPMAVIEDVMTDKSEMSSILVKIFIGKGKIESLLQMLITSEIKKSSPDTLFSDNSLATKCIIQYLRITGTLYLQSILSKIIACIFKENKYCEIDKTLVEKKYRTKLINKKITKRSHKDIRRYVQMILSSIRSSLSACPYGIRRLFSMLLESLRRAYSEKNDLWYMILSKFFFLHYLIPSILNPKIYYLTSDHPNIKTSRTLTLIAKALKIIGSMNCQPCKESFMIPMLPYMEKQTTLIRAFTKDISTVFHDRSPLVSSHKNQLFSHTTIIMAGWAHKLKVRLGDGNRMYPFKKKYFSLSYTALSYASRPSLGHSLTSTKIVAVSDIISVERVDRLVFGNKYVIQILISNRNSDVAPTALYVRLKSTNEITEWISSLYKTCLNNKRILNYYHPGSYKSNKWTCCSGRPLATQGCSKTKRSVVLCDWRDPLNIDYEIQTIFLQLITSINVIRSKYLRGERWRSMSFTSVQVLKNSSTSSKNRNTRQSRLKRTKNNSLKSTLPDKEKGNFNVGKSKPLSLDEIEINLKSEELSSVSKNVVRLLSLLDIISHEHKIH